MASPLLVRMLVVGVPLLIALAAIAALIRFKSRHGITLVQAIFYGLNVALNGLVWRTTATRTLPVKPGQGAIIVANHTSSVDPFFLQMGTIRVVHWLVAREYFQHWLMGGVLRALEAIPVNRGGVDTAATKLSIRKAQAGGLVGIFPEGRINTTDKLLLPGRPGAAMIALKARVPIIPCYIGGAPYDGTALGSFLMRARVRVVMGDPIDTSEFFGREREEGVTRELTRRLMVEIARLAGRPDFVPELAGRRWKTGETEPLAVGAAADLVQPNGQSAPAVEDSIASDNA